MLIISIDNGDEGQEDQYIEFSHSREGSIMTKIFRTYYSRKELSAERCDMHDTPSLTIMQKGKKSQKGIR